MTTANPHLRAIAIAGALALVALLLGSYTLNHRGGGTASDVTTPPITHPAATHPATATHAAATKPAPAKHAVAKPTPKAATTTPVHAAAKPKPAPARPKPAAVPAVVQAALAYGLPKPVATQFAGHPVVVVSLFSSQSAIDEQIRKEAEAGAFTAGAGFAAVDVSKEGASGAIAKLLGVVDAPATLVFQAPDTASVQQFAAAKAAQPKPRYPAAANPTVTAPAFKLFVKLPGYNDADTVAQAATNAAPPPAAAAAPTSWARAADGLCTRTAAKVAAVGSIDSVPKLKQVLPTVKSAAAAYVAGLKKLKPPAGQQDEVATFIDLTSSNLALTMQIAEATAKKDTVDVALLAVRQDSVSRQADALATRLGATACAGGF